MSGLKTPPMFLSVFEDLLKTRNYTSSAHKVLYTCFGWLLGTFPQWECPSLETFVTPHLMHLSGKGLRKAASFAHMAAAYCSDLANHAFPAHACIMSRRDEPRTNDWRPELPRRLDALHQYFSSHGLRFSCLSDC